MNKLKIPIAIVIFIVLLLVAFYYYNSIKRNNKWCTFTEPSSIYQIDFPSIPQTITQENPIYVGKDRLGNLFAIQKFVPPPEYSENQTSKEKLSTAIKILILKDNVKLDETNYLIYEKEFVAVDFKGQLTEKDKVFWGRIILEGNSMFYLYSVLSDRSDASVRNYNRFINSFQMI
jgi:hypothetical protein